ncbi:helix-turn-helix domain-containing protein [Corynebacterium pelargi]|uniref:helix-turn-helix domain-containing protein n=1 Tax=Corynebacterium pelargi TaxID=1471400 RepID=UPI001008E72D|nr:AraC family transcriptional regulator [Corynebacterium pelargi]GGG78345.1 HTH-type transcriptional regulator RipA [Corynebacterium pelargi]
MLNVPMHPSTTTQLLWCVEGSATLITHDRLVPLSAGDLLIAPQGSYVQGTATVLPMACPIDAAQPRRLRLGVQWNSFMVYEFSRQRIGGRGLSPELSNLVRATTYQPVMPTSTEARTVARQLRRHPASQKSLLRFAEQVGVSSRTLQRQFLKETGLIFSEWRAAQRVHAAIALLEQRLPVAQVSKRVGFQAASSLNRAFQRHTGFTPAAFAVHAGVGKKQAPAPSVPQSTMFARARTDVVMWIYAGTATVTTPGYCRFVAQGDTVTIPAGTDTRLDVAAGSVALALSLEQAEGPITLEQIARNAWEAPMEALSEAELAAARQSLQPQLG